MSAPRGMLPGEVARLLGLVNARSFLARLPALRAQGFPPPLICLGRRWDRRAVERWLDSQMDREVGNASRAEDELVRRARALAEAPAC